MALSKKKTITIAVALADDRLLSRAGRLGRATRARVAQGPQRRRLGERQWEIDAIVEVPESVTSQSRHSLTLSGSPPHGKLLIPFERRDVRVVEGARLESVCRGNSTVGSNPTLSANRKYMYLKN
jgi:hypothetical protein